MHGCDSAGFVENPGPGLKVHVLVCAPWGVHSDHSVHCQLNELPPPPPPPLLELPPLGAVFSGHEVSEPEQSWSMPSPQVSDAPGLSAALLSLQSLLAK